MININFFNMTELENKLAFAPVMADMMEEEMPDDGMGGDAPAEDKDEEEDEEMMDGSDDLE